NKPLSLHLQNIRPSDQLPFSPKYVVAVCGVTSLVDTIDLSSVVVDQSEKHEGLQKRILQLQNEVEGKNAWAVSLEEQTRNLGQIVAHYQKEVHDLEARLEGAHQHISKLDAHVAFLGENIGSLQEQVRAQSVTISSLQQQIESQALVIRDREAELMTIKTSDFWKVATRYWRLRDRLLPPGSRRRRLLKHGFRSALTGVQSMVRLGRGGSRRPAAAEQALRENENPHEDPGGPAEPIEFAASDRPTVSIIIPVFNCWAHTYRCLQSIARTMAGAACEIILADDGSTDTTARAGEILIGARVLRNGQNCGFLHNCNRAAGNARGKYLYFLNNDTELKPGAIQALASVLDRDPAAGMVGSQLVYPDGRLQEAGGIIWSDATGWNYGRGQNPSLPGFSYLKEVDYVSGASFMIRRDLWKEIGGFDARYAPAYCEDSDLAFEVRKRGFKVIYQPKSVVVHFEGASHGTDVSENAKAYQVRNTGILKEKWAEALSCQFPSGVNVFQARDRSAGRKVILMIDHYVPHFDKDAGSRTIWSFIQANLQMGMNVKFLGDNFYPHQPYTDLLQQAGVEVLVGHWFAGHWQEWLAENGRWIDYVFLSRPHIAPKYLPSVRACTKARVLYYVHDLEHLREIRLAELADDATLRDRAERSRNREQQVMNAAEVVFSCSHTETEVIRELCPDTRVLHVPAYAFDVDLHFDFNPARRAGLLFVAGFSHPPNVDGVLWFVRDVWPAVRERLPGVVFQIVGSAPPPEVLALESDNVKVLGFVSEERLKELYLAARLVVIPLRYGAGVKGKTVEAMAYGVPVVCTHFGVEGMPGVEEILDPLQHLVPMADGIASLYHDLPRLMEISGRERAYVARHFTIEKIQEAFALAMASCE
ncbi:MAG: glycosyltransferase, partial [Acidobacteriota bacterium]